MEHLPAQVRAVAVVAHLFVWLDVLFHVLQIVWLSSTSYLSIMFGLQLALNTILVLILTLSNLETVQWKSGYQCQQLRRFFPLMGTWALHTGLDIALLITMRFGDFPDPLQWTSGAVGAFVLHKMTCPAMFGATQSALFKLTHESTFVDF
eukprot:m.83168 g.83168  ORF g.83168 m.83168 type:complete len:150 (+) comp12715_c1_seq3:865-1314(+)